MQAACRGAGTRPRIGGQRNEPDNGCCPAAPRPCDGKRSIAEDLATLGLGIGDPAATGRLFAEFLAGDGGGFDQVPVSTYRALADVFDRRLLSTARWRSAGTGGSRINPVFPPACRGPVRTHCAPVFFAFKFPQQAGWFVAANGIVNGRAARFE